MRKGFRHAISTCMLLAGLAIALAPRLSAQGYTLDSAALGTSTNANPNARHNQPFVTIPKAGRAVSVQSLRLNVSGAGKGCTTDRLLDYWTPAGTPAGVTMDWSHDPMALPSIPTRTVVINVNSNAVPTSRKWTIFVARGSCGGSNQQATMTLHLVKAP
jgi:hypothetical protein